jgi:hypothetical protein
MQQRGTGSITIAAAGLGLALALVLPAATRVQAQGAIIASGSAAERMTDVSAQQRDRRPPRRLRIYPRYAPDGVFPRYDPGPNAVRDCTATYVQEYRPSGTVITPRMNCFWRPG